MPQSFNTIIGETTPCAVGPKCNWDMLNFGGWNFNGPGFEPTGEPLFETGASSNSGSYSDSTEDKLITMTHTSSASRRSTSTRPTPRSSCPSSGCRTPTRSRQPPQAGGVAFNPLGDFLPEYWYFTK